MSSVHATRSSQSVSMTHSALLTVTVPAISVVVVQSQRLSSPPLESTTSQTPTAKGLATIGNLTRAPEKLTGVSQMKRPSSSNTAFTVREKPGESVSNALNVPTPGQGSPTWTMSLGGEGVNVTVPIFPPRGTISTISVTLGVFSLVTVPDTMTPAVPPESIATFPTESSAP